MIRHSQEMRPSRWCAGPLAVALVLAAGQVNAAFEVVNPRFDLYDVKICGKVVGEFKIEHHLNTLGGDRIFSAYATGYYPLLKEGVELRWVQLVSTTHPLHTDAQPNTPYFYPGERDPLGDGDPFYWNTSVRTRSGSLRDEYFYRTHWSGPVQRDDYAEYRLWFYYGPSRGDELPGDKPYTWKAELSLVCWEKGSKKFGVLGTATYGFKQDQPFRPSIISHEILRNPVWLTQERLNQYFDGWTMVDACEACLVPEPAACLQMGALLGMSGLGVVASRRRAGRSGRNGTK